MGSEGFPSLALMKISGVVEPERAGTAFRYFFNGRNAVPALFKTLNAKK
jgi:hypothetical protein